LLGRLGLPFDAEPPDTDEADIPGEEPHRRALRLAVDKARSRAAADTIVIGSDQVAALDGRVLHKPGTAERNLEQLLACQGQCVDFLTAVAVAHGDALQTHVDHTQVVFRSLPRSSLEFYIKQEQPFACAGGFKAEGLGIALFERIESSDPTALIGLPLIWLAAALRETGFDPLGAALHQARQSSATPRAKTSGAARGAPAQH
jgi:septum formation protein